MMTTNSQLQRARETISKSAVRCPEVPSHLRENQEKQWRKQWVALQGEFPGSRVPGMDTSMEGTY
jgi:hypothetical protein